MWAVAQKCCWAPARGPHKGSQIISLQCKCDDSGSRGSLAVQPPPPLPCSASPALVLGGYWEHWLQRDFGRHSAFRAHSSCPSDFGTGTAISQILTDPSLQVSLESGRWPEWAGPFPHEAPTQVWTKPLFSESERGDWQELGEEQQQGSAEPSVTGRAQQKFPSPAGVSDSSSPSQDPRSPWAEVQHCWGTGRRDNCETGEQLRKERAKESRETGMEGLGSTAWRENKIQWDAQIWGN